VHQLKALVGAIHELPLLNFWRCLLFCQSIVFLSNFMKPTTIYLPEETENQVQEIANNTGKSIAELIQDLIISQFPQSSKKLPKSVGMGASGRSKLFSKAEQLLWTKK